jgi:hypothetical protein
MGTDSNPNEGDVALRLGAKIWATQQMRGSLGNGPLSVVTLVNWLRSASVPKTGSDRFRFRGEHELNIANVCVTNGRTGQLWPHRDYGGDD